MGSSMRTILLVLGCLLLVYAVIAIFMGMVEQNPTFGLQGFVAGVLGFIFTLLGKRKKKVQEHTNRSNNDPLQILKQRYAIGEISEEEYEEMKRKLEG